MGAAPHSNHDTPAAFPWVREGDRYRCLRHAITWAPNEPNCASRPGPSSCQADPPPPPDAEEQEAPFTAPKGCWTGDEIERAMLADLKQIRSLRNGVARRKNKTPREYNAIAKLQDAATKLLRAMAERAQERENNELVRRRELRWLRQGARH